MANEQDKQTQNTSFGAGNQSTESSKTNKSDSPSFSSPQNSQSSQSPQNQAQNSTSQTQNSPNQTSSTDLSIESAKETAKGFYDQAKSTVGEAYGAATKRATEVLDEQKGTLAGGLTTVADSIKQVGENLNTTEEQNKITETAAKYTNSLAEQIENLSSYFERKDVREMVSDIEAFARKYPAYFIGGAFALGFLAARFLKSSSPRQLTQKAGQPFNTERGSESEAKPATNPS